MTGLFPWGVYGPGMDQYIRDDTELGGRAAMGLDAENNWEDLVSVRWQSPGITSGSAMQSPEFAGQA